MTQYSIAYIATAVVFLVVDLVWLTQIARQFYASMLGDLLLEQPNVGIAVGFYLVYVLGIIIFAVAPALKTGELQTALIYGCLFGFFAYATYDLTNLATLKGWPVMMAVVDIAWGTMVTGISAVSGFLITRTVFGG